MLSAYDYVVNFLKLKRAFWQWDGHTHVAELTSGKRSDVFADCTPFFTLRNEQDRVANYLLAKLMGEEDIPPEIDTAPNVWVVGSAQGAIGLSQSLAAFLVAQDYARSAYTEPGEPRPGDTMYSKTKKPMELKRFDLGDEPYVILCEDVVSTGGTTDKTVAGIMEAHPDAVIHPKVLCIVDRTPGDFKWKYDILSLVRLHPRVWEGDHCPPEMKGCVPIRPRGAPGNWDKLTTEKQTEV